MAAASSAASSASTAAGRASMCHSFVSQGRCSSSYLSPSTKKRCVSPPSSVSKPVLFDRGRKPRLLVYHELDIPVRRDTGVENVVRSRNGNLQALQQDAGRQWAVVSSLQNFPDPNRADVAKERLPFPASSQRGNPDIG